MSLVLVVGTSKNSIKEYKEARDKFGKHDTIAINFATLFVKDPTYIISLHSDLIPMYSEISRITNRQYPNKKIYETVSRKEGEMVDNIFKQREGSLCGSSGFYATKFALSKGYDKIILCGIPIDASGNLYSLNEGIHDQIYLGKWKGYNFRNKVRSMSGNTKELLGEPTKEWIIGGNE